MSIECKTIFILYCVKAGNTGDKGQHSEEICCHVEDSWYVKSTISDILMSGIRFYYQ